MYKPKDGPDQMKVGIFFESLHQMKMALKDWAIRGAFRIRKVEFERRRVVITCYGENCKCRFYILRTKIRGLYQIKSLKGEHVC